MDQRYNGRDVVQMERQIGRLEGVLEPLLPDDWHDVQKLIRLHESLIAVIRDDEENALLDGLAAWFNLPRAAVHAAADVLRTQIGMGGRAVAITN